MVVLVVVVVATAQHHLDAVKFPRLDAKGEVLRGRDRIASSLLRHGEYSGPILSRKFSWMSMGKVRREGESWGDELKRFEIEGAILAKGRPTE